MKSTKQTFDLEKYGRLACEIIADYPLYAKTSGITYGEAIELAKVFYPDMTTWVEVVGELTNE